MRKKSAADRLRPPDALSVDLWERTFPEHFALLEASLAGKLRKLPRFTRNQPCPADGIVVKDHPCCSACKALSGAAHTIKDLVSGLCESCSAARARRGQ